MHQESIDEDIEQFLAILDTDPARALGVARQLVERTPENARAWTALGHAHRARSALPDALHAYETAVALEETAWEAWTSLGFTRWDMADAAGAENAYRRSLALAPRQSGALAGLGHVALGDGRLHDAMALFTDALRIRPDLYFALIGQVAALRRLDRVSDAIFLLKLLTESGADVPSLWHEVVGCAAKGGRIEPDLIRSAPTEVVSAVAVGTYRAIGAVAALPVASLAWERTDGRPERPEILGEIFREARQYLRGLACYDLAIAADPSDAYSIAGRAECLRMVGRHSEAAVEYERSLGLLPEHGFAWMGLASARAALGDHAAAVDSWRRALTLDPENAFAKEGMARAQTMAAGRAKPQ